MSEGVTLAKHPAFAVPDLRAVIAACGGDVVAAEHKWVELLKRRNELIRNAKAEPLTHGWEPDKWHLCDALLGRERDLPWWKDTHDGLTYAEWTEMVRAKLGYQRPINSLLILGGNRAGKTEYEAKRSMQTLLTVPESIVWPMHQKGTMSIEYHHKLHYKYLPSNLRDRDIKSRTTYISYKQKTGFSDHKFVLPNASECSYRFYEMDQDKAIEGGEPNEVWCDELVPPAWVQTLQYRIATRDGLLVVTFTPIHGYSATVQLFMDGSETVLWEPGYLVPKDDGPAIIHRALGFDSEEHMAAEHHHGRWSIPWSVDKWLATGTGLPPVPEGRRFRRMPLVAKCAREDSAVVWFHSSDNPYGRPNRVAEKAVNEKSIDNCMVRFYGFTTKAISAMFARFDAKVHVVDPSEIPTEGTNYMVQDPAGGRNAFFTWLRVGRDGRRFVYREWPGNYEIPGLGVPGLWAEPDGKHPDGKKGPAQEPFGFGLMDYLGELARLEGWPEGWRERVRSHLEASGDDMDSLLAERAALQARGATFLSEIEGATGTPSPDEGARETIATRFIDSRAANVASTEHKRPVTLQERLQNMGVDFELTPGDSIAEGVTLINTMLAYDTTREMVEGENEPALYISSACVNTIFSLRTWTGSDGNKGACKDPVDNLRYLLLAGCEYEDPDLGAGMVQESWGHL